MLKSRIFAAVAFSVMSANASAPALALAEGAASVASESSSGSAAATDITASNVWWDLCLLYNGGTAAGFNALSSCVSATRRYDYFQYVCSKPYKADLYAYFYFDNDNGYGFAYDDSGETAYHATIAVERESASGTVEWSNSGDFALTKVGTSYNVGTQYLVKFKVGGLFVGATASSTFDYSIADFGAYSGSEYAPAVGVNCEQAFSYVDDQYDMTAQLWGTESTTVSVIAESAKPMTVKQFDGGEWATLISNGLGGSVAGVGSGYYENHFAFFDLDKATDQMLSLDLYYTMVEFYAEGLYHDETYDYNFDPNSDATSAGDYYFDTPTGVGYAAGNAIEKKYAGGEYATVRTQKAANCYTLNPDGSPHTIDNVEVNKTWGTPFQYSYTRHIPQIVSNNALDTAVSDASTREWLRGNAVKADGSLYQYSVCFDSTEREWTGEETREETDRLFGWPWGLPLSDHHYNLFRAHTAQGIIMGRMTVVAAGEQLDWNAFSQSINEGPDVPASPGDSFSFNEMLIAFNKRNAGWLIPLAMAGFYAACAAVVAGLTLLTANSGAQTVRLSVLPQQRGGTAKPKKRGKGSR